MNIPSIHSSSVHQGLSLFKQEFVRSSSWQKISHIVQWPFRSIAACFRWIKNKVWKNVSIQTPSHVKEESIRPQIGSYTNISLLRAYLQKQEQYTALIHDNEVLQKRLTGLNEQILKQNTYIQTTKADIAEMRKIIETTVAQKDIDLNTAYQTIDSLGKRIEELSQDSAIHQKTQQALTESLQEQKETHAKVLEVLHKEHVAALNKNGENIKETFSKMFLRSDFEGCVSTPPRRSSRLDILRSSTPGDKKRSSTPVPRKPEWKK